MPTENHAAGPIRVDGLQFANWSEKIFRQMRTGGVDAVHATIAYHGDFRDIVRAIQSWNERFLVHGDLILPGRTGDDVRRARDTGRTAILFGLQNPSPIGDDLGLVEILHSLGVRFMQLSYNNQSLLATGYCEEDDPGITRMGREVIHEMNRVGMVIDLSHSSERSTLEAMAISRRPVAITHANPSAWYSTPRNKSPAVLRALADSGGMLGFSLYPKHLRDGSSCTLESFCRMVAETAGFIGSAFLGLGSDLCQDQPGSVLRWMRHGRWYREREKANPSSTPLDFPEQPEWFCDNRDFDRIAAGLRDAGLKGPEVDGIMGETGSASSTQASDRANDGDGGQHGHDSRPVP